MREFLLLALGLAALLAAGRGHRALIGGILK